MWVYYLSGLQLPSHANMLQELSEVLLVTTSRSSEAHINTLDQNLDVEFMKDGVEVCQLESLEAV